MNLPVSSTRRLPFAFARRCGVLEDLTVSSDGSVRVLARTDSDDDSWREARRFLGKPLRIAFYDASTFDELLTRAYREETERSDDPADTLSFEAEDDQAIGPRDLLEDDVEAPVIQLANGLVREALKLGASDIHVEPLEGSLRVRFRVDGVLRTALERPDVPVRRVVSRFKVMAGLDIAERRLPQDGRMSLRLGGRSIDVRVSSLPSQYGERVVLRLLDRSAELLSFDQIGLAPNQKAALDQMIAKTNGIVLATGPTGSGKTTTLYTLMQRLNDIGRNIMTVEDPVEYDLPGVSQSQVNGKIGMGFAESLRAILRQDPDVILVGEIRDSETARIAVRASMTGHLVLSTLHTNTAAGAITRLVDLGVEPFLLKSTLRGVVAQRLVRRLCPGCSRQATTTEADASWLARWKVEAPESLSTPGEGCIGCAGLAYRHRLGVYEILEIGGRIPEMIRAGASESDIQAEAMQPDEHIFAHALRAVARGETSREEAVRAVADST